LALRTAITSLPEEKDTEDRFTSFLARVKKPPQEMRTDEKEEPHTGFFHIEKKGSCQGKFAGKFAGFFSIYETLLSLTFLSIVLTFFSVDPSFPSFSAKGGHKRGSCY
jgi:hypothetical protein